MSDAATTVHYRTCPLCEATCGLEITMAGSEVKRIRGDRDDVFSKGYICPKGSTIKDLDTDPNRVRRPLIKRDGQFCVASWDEAFELIDARINGIRHEHGNDAVACYIGNPNAHSLAGAFYTGDVIKSLRTKNVFSASTVDQMPKQVSAGLMFGTVISVPVPDVDRTAYLLMLGADPYESNGSLFTAPDLPGRLEAMRARGGRLVVVDPRNSKTAKNADEHISIVPGTDAYWLFAIAHVLFADGLVDVGHCADHISGLETVRELAKEFSPETVATLCGVHQDVTRRIAHELAAAPCAAVYGRIGTCTQEFGTLSSWLVDVLNVLTGNLDRPGGAMFTTPAVGAPHTRGQSGIGRGVSFNRWSSRVNGHPEVFGEFPVTTLPDEIESAGEGQVRAMVVIGGNPVSSNPDSGRVDRAIKSLDFLISVDMYVNETSRHADVILPTNRILTKSHYDFALYALATRNIANFSPPVIELDDAFDERHEWQTLLRLAAIFDGRGHDVDVEALDDAKARDLCAKTVSFLPEAHRCSADEFFERVGERKGPDRLIDISLRTGPYSAPSPEFADGLSLDVLVQAPHGVDLGPLQQRVPEVLRTSTGTIELAPSLLVADVQRLHERARSLAVLHSESKSSLALVGRRHVRSNNSWMHNVSVLVKGRNRFTMQMNPVDAERLGVADGQQVRVSTDVGSLLVDAELTADVMAGVVSIPHGWGQNLDGVSLDVAVTKVSANTNVLIRPQVDIPSGNAVLTGLRVDVSPVP